MKLKKGQCMRRYHRNFFLFLSILLLACSISIIARRMSRKQNISSIEQKTEKPIIIFDLINVLFKENQIGFAQKIGYGTLTSYAITHWKNPGHRCLDMLHAISRNNTQQPHITISLNGKTMPRCIVELHEGKKTCIQVKKEIHESIDQLDKEKFFTSIKEKTLMNSIMNLILDPGLIASITEPIKPMITLAQKLKSNGYPLYLFANIPQEFYLMLQNKYSSIISLFDGIVISSQIQVAKPHHSLFQHLLTTHNLDPKKCILIDNSKENIDTAQSLGIRGIVYEKLSGLIQYLKKEKIDC
jgi:HAD superfamily hydrolase (TIGR01509 family)